MPGLWTDVDRLADPDSDYAVEAVQQASYIMWLLTGRKFSGVGSTTETYCQNRYGGSLVDSIEPRVISANIYNVCGDCRSCSHVIRLRGRPIINVTSVMTGDTSVPLTDVNIIDRSGIAPASGCWGTCEDVTVSYEYGSRPPLAGTRAATDLANQFIWAANEDARCTLPERVTSVTRQGVSWTLLDTQDFLEQGRTGVYTVDLFIKAVNPHSAQMRPRVFSPDLPSAQTRRSAATTVSTPQYPPSAP